MERKLMSGAIYKYQKVGLTKHDWKKYKGDLLSTNGSYQEAHLVLHEEDSDKHVSIPLNNCAKVRHGKPHSSKNHVIDLTVNKKVITLSTDSEKEFTDWYKALALCSSESKSVATDLSKLDISQYPAAPLPKFLPSSSTPPGNSMEYNSLYQSSDDFNIPVTLRSSPLAEILHLQGEYILGIDNTKLSIISCKDGTVKHSWLYKTIRKYGRDKGSFSMEVGRRSSTGPGVLTFNTPHGNDIFYRVQNFTVAMNAPRTPLPPGVNSGPVFPPKPANLPGVDFPLLPLRENHPVSKAPFAKPKAEGLKVHPVEKPHQPKVDSPERVTRPFSIPTESEYSAITDIPAAPLGMRKPPIVPKPGSAELVLYAETTQVGEDGWKKFGRTQENIHTEMYGRVEQSLVHPKVKPPKPAKIVSAVQAVYGVVTPKDMRNRPGSERRTNSRNLTQEERLYSEPETTHEYGVVERDSQPPPVVDSDVYDHLARTKPTQGMNQYNSSSGYYGGHESQPYDHLQRNNASKGDFPPPPQEDVYDTVQTGEDNPVNLVADAEGYFSKADIGLEVIDYSQAVAPQYEEENAYALPGEEGY